MHCGGNGHLGLFHTRACGHCVVPDLDGFFGLLGVAGRVLALYQGLLDHTGRLVRRDGPAAFERPRAGAAGHQKPERKPSTEDEGKVIYSGRVLNR